MGMKNFYKVSFLFQFFKNDCVTGDFTFVQIKNWQEKQ